jgi:hypothetical protein
MRRIYERAVELEEEKRERERRSDEILTRRREARDAPTRTVMIEDRPDPVFDPDRYEEIDVIARPVPMRIPDRGPQTTRADPAETPVFPEVPAPGRVTVPISVPGTLPGTRPATRPATQPATRPATRPITAPSPLRHVIPLATPFLFPVRSPVRSPFAQPTPTPFAVPTPTPLTPVQPTGVPSRLTAMQTQRARSQQCEPCPRTRDKQKRKRDRRVCYKGLFSERTRSEKRTRWQRVDCRTGREL